MRRVAVRGIRFVFVSLLAHLAACSAQSQALTAQQIHDRIAAIMARTGGLQLPSGDTTVTWLSDQGPILYHTTARNADGLHVGMLRNDNFVGVNEVVTDGTTPVRFIATWMQGDSVLLNDRGARTDSLFVVEGRAQRAYRLPDIAWTVADIGMEELLIPIMRRLASGPASHPIAVYRPFNQRWDTLFVQVARDEDGLRVTFLGEPEKPVMFIASTGEMLRIVGAAGGTERRPLENSRLYKAYLTIRERADRVNPAR